jgi:hypothetical protein
MLCTMCVSVRGAGSGGCHCKSVIYVCCSTDTTFHQITLWVDICEYLLFPGKFIYR